MTSTQKRGNIFCRHASEIAEDSDRSLCFLCLCRCTLLLCSCRSHSFHTELSVDCFQLFMFCLWARVIRMEKGNLHGGEESSTHRHLRQHEKEKKKKSILRKHLHQFENMCCKCARVKQQRRTAKNRNA